MATECYFCIHDPFLLANVGDAPLEGSSGDVDDIASFGIAFPRRVVYLVHGNRDFARVHGSKYPHLRFTHDDDAELPKLFKETTALLLCAPVTEQDPNLLKLLLQFACAGKRVYMQGSLRVGYNFTASAPALQQMLLDRGGVLDYSTKQTNRTLTFEQLRRIVPDAGILARMMQYSVATLVLPPSTHNLNTLRICLPQRLYVEGNAGFAGNNLKGLLELAGVDLAGLNASWFAAAYLLKREGGGVPLYDDPKNACEEALLLPCVQAALARPAVRAYLDSPNEQGVPMRDWLPQYRAQLEVAMALLVECVPAWLAPAFEGAVMPDRSTPIIKALSATEFEAFLPKKTSPMWDLVLTLAVVHQITPEQLSAEAQPMEELLLTKLFPPE